MEFTKCTRKELDKFLADYPIALVIEEMGMTDPGVYDPPLRIYNEFSDGKKVVDGIVAKTIIRSVREGEFDEHFIRTKLWVPDVVPAEGNAKLTYPDSTPTISLSMPKPTFTIYDDGPGTFFKIESDGSYTKADRFTPEVAIGIVLGAVTSRGTEAGIRGAKAIAGLGANLDVTFEAIIHGLRATYRDEGAEE